VTKVDQLANRVFFSPASVRAEKRKLPHSISIHRPQPNPIKPCLSLLTRMLASKIFKNYASVGVILLRQFNMTGSARYLLNLSRLKQNAPKMFSVVDLVGGKLFAFFTL
jgi:hypothetical protein